MISLASEDTGTDETTWGRVEADEAMPSWCTSGKSERHPAGSQSPAKKKRARESLTGSCSPASTTNTSNSEARIEPTINIGNLSCSGGSICIVINLSSITAALSISIVCSCLYDLNSSLTFFTLCFQSTVSFYSSISLLLLLLLLLLLIPPCLVLYFVSFFSIWRVFKINCNDITNEVLCFAKEK